MGKDLNGKILAKGISQRPDGRYMARYTDSRKIRHTFYDNNIKRLEKKLADARYESEHGIYGDGKALALNEWFEEFMVLYKIGKIKDTTVHKNRILYKSCVKNRLGDRKLADIKAVHIQNFINELFEKGLAYGTVRNVKSLLSEMFKRAIANEYMLRNPCDCLIMPKKPRIDSRFLTNREQKIFLDAAKEYYHYDIFLFALTSGMRIGEILGLKWSDIDFEKKCINVQRTLHYNKVHEDEPCHFFFTSPKTETSYRNIPLLKENESILKSLKCKQMKNRILNAKRWKEKSPFDNMVFLSTDGAPVRYGDVNRTIKLAIAKANALEEQIAKEENREPFLLENFSPHCFRHTYVTRCRENDVPLDLIQNIVGHSNEEMTLYYAHNEKKMDLSLLQQISFLDVV